MFLHCTSFLGVGTCDLISLFKKFFNGRGVLVDVVLIPSLLKIVVAVAIASVAVAEGDILDIVGSQTTCLWREIVFHILHKKRMCACDNVNKH